MNVPSWRNTSHIHTPMPKKKQYLYINIKYLFIYDVECIWFNAMHVHCPNKYGRMDATTLKFLILHYYTSMVGTNTTINMHTKKDDANTKGLTAQCQRSLAGVLLPRVRILGATPLWFRGFPWSFLIKKTKMMQMQECNAKMNGI